MDKTKTMGVKNPSYSSTLESETSHSPPPKNQDNGKSKGIEVSSKFDLEATMTITPYRAKSIMIVSPRKRCSKKEGKLGKNRKRSK